MLVTYILFKLCLHIKFYKKKNYNLKFFSLKKLM